MGQWLREYWGLIVFWAVIVAVATGSFWVGVHLSRSEAERRAELFQELTGIPVTPEQARYLELRVDGRPLEPAAVSGKIEP